MTIKLRGEETGWWDLLPGDDVDRFTEFAPEGTTIWATDAAGITVLINDPEIARVNVADCDYVTALALGQETYISRFVTGRITGERQFLVARRRLDMLDYWHRPLKGGGKPRLREAFAASPWLLPRESR